MAKSIMVLGTMSNVGKSVITAGLCRIFAQDGYKTAPFKSQNMALNSYITHDGKEMGRAQVMQAECAWKEPDVRMNPILLKPTSDCGSQVIIDGEVIGNMSAAAYYAYKPKLMEKVLSSYNDLASENDIMVIEGAGSPVEINLMKNDIVNIGLAQATKSPCLLVGDIDRGGVFASLYGTIGLLGQDTSLVKGVVINKFRGDAAILKPGLDQLTQLIHLPVLGVVPYHYLDIDDEDSLSSRLTDKTASGLIDIAVVRLPRISNFTDYNLFQQVENVSLRYVGSVKEFNNPDMVILPGSKNTIEDLLWLRQAGIEGEILKHAAKGKPVFGVCGGYQMLGLTLKDAVGAESGKQTSGLGLLHCHTKFMAEKVGTRVKGTFASLSGPLKSLKGIPFLGYEIHMGITKAEEEGESLSFLDNGEPLGHFQDNIYGTYVHGIFDSGDVVEAILKDLCVMKGVSYDMLKPGDWQDKKEGEYDKLADILRQSLDMKAIYRIIERGVTDDTNH